MTMEKKSAFAVTGSWETLQHFKRTVKKFGWEFIYSKEDKAMGYTELYFQILFDSGSELKPGSFWFCNAADMAVNIRRKTNFAKAKKFLKENYPKK